MGPRKNTRAREKRRKLGSKIVLFVVVAKSLSSFHIVIKKKTASSHPITINWCCIKREGGSKKKKKTLGRSIDRSFVWKERKDDRYDTLLLRRASEAMACNVDLSALVKGLPRTLTPRSVAVSPMRQK